MYSMFGRTQALLYNVTGLPVITMDVSYAAKSRVVMILKLTSRWSLSLLLCGTYLQYLVSTYFIEYTRTYVFLHDFTYQIQSCSISQRQDSL